MNDRKYVYFIRLAVSLVVVGALFWLIDPDNFPDLDDLKFRFVGLAFLLVIADRLLNAYKWNVLIQSKGLPVQLIDVVRIYFKSSFIGLVLPSGIGSELLKGYSLSKTTLKSIDSASSVVMDRIIGVVSLTGVCVFAYYLSGPELQSIAAVVVGKNVALLILVCAAITSLLGFLTPSVERLPFKSRGRIARIVSKVFSSFYDYRKHKAMLAYSLALALVIQVVRVALVWLCGVGVGLSLNLSYFVLFVPFTHLIATIPIALAGIGVEEGAAVYFFSLIGVDAGAILGAVLLSHVLVIFSLVPGGWIYFKEGAGAHAQKRRPTNNAAKDEEEQKPSLV